MESKLSVHRTDDVLSRAKAALSRSRQYRKSSKNVFSSTGGSSISKEGQEDYQLRSGVSKFLGEKKGRKEIYGKEMESSDTQSFILKHKHMMNSSSMLDPSSSETESISTPSLSSLIRKQDLNEKETSTSKKSETMRSVKIGVSGNMDDSDEEDSKQDKRQISHLPGNIKNTLLGRTILTQPEMVSSEYYKVLSDIQSEDPPKKLASIESISEKELSYSEVFEDDGSLWASGNLKSNVSDDLIKSKYIISSEFSATINSKSSTMEAPLTDSIKSQPTDPATTSVVKHSLKDESTDSVKSEDALSVLDDVKSFIKVDPKTLMKEYHKDYSKKVRKDSVKEDPSDSSTKNKKKSIKKDLQPSVRKDSTRLLKSDTKTSFHQKPLRRDLKSSVKTDVKQGAQRKQNASDIFKSSDKSPVLKKEKSSSTEFSRPPRIVEDIVENLMSLEGLSIVTSSPNDEDNFTSVPEPNVSEKNADEEAQKKDLYESINQSAGRTKSHSVFAKLINPEHTYKPESQTEDDTPASQILKNLEKNNFRGFRDKNNVKHKSKLLGLSSGADYSLLFKSLEAKTPQQKQIQNILKKEVFEKELKRLRRVRKQQEALNKGIDIMVRENLFKLSQQTGGVHPVSSDIIPEVVNSASLDKERFPRNGTYNFSVPDDDMSALSQVMTVPKLVEELLASNERMYQMTKQAAKDLDRNYKRRLQKLEQIKYR